MALTMRQNSESCSVRIRKSIGNPHRATRSAPLQVGSFEPKVIAIRLTHPALVTPK